jgi:hypothetical protein
MNWISVKDRLPICFGRGNWDGLRSDLVLTIDNKGDINIALVYNGFMDGSEFENWYTKNDYEVENEVTHWMPLPEPPKQS